MTPFLANKRILLGVTGSIAAYKSADLVRRLKEAGAIVRVAMTENAKQFITPLTMQAVSGFPVHDDLFDREAEAAMGHIELARFADLVLVAPATADFMARLAAGVADDLLTTLCLATKAPIALAPAMNQGMWCAALTQDNEARLKKRGVMIWGPAEGDQACGDIGPGRMMEPAELVQKVSELFATGTLSGCKVLMTAGPTHEAIDPIRYIANGSSGKMGYALAEAAREAGASVTLVSGPVNLKAPDGVEIIPVMTALHMQDAVMKKISDYDIFLAVAAVSDYRPETIAQQKMHKQDESINITLVRNPDIVATVGNLQKPPFIVGFAAETENVLESARKKREGKHMDLIIANRVGHGEGIGSDENEVTVLGEAFELHLPKTTKEKLARELIAVIAERFKAKNEG